MTTKDPCGSGVCGPSDGNKPLCEGALSRSIGVRLQPAVDRARRIAHSLGLRRERVFIVWQEQHARTREWAEAARLELMPVKVEWIERIDKVLGENGLVWSGEVLLSEVSPSQVSIATLQGKRDGVDWADRSTREVFFEIIRYQRCASDPPEQRLRFTPASEVEAPPFEYRFRLLAQHLPRTPEGKDAGLTKPRRRGDFVVTT